MARLTPEQVAQKWQNSAASAGQAYEMGVRAVREAPGVRAAAQAQTWANNTAAAKEKFAQNSAKVSLAQWQDAAINKGAARFTDGVGKGAPKFASYMSKALPRIYSLQEQIRAMPKGTSAQAEARMLANMRGMRELKGL